MRCIMRWSVSRELTARLERSVQAVQGRRLSLVSGAGHEGVVMSALTRSRCGFAVSRWAESPPGASASSADLKIALRVIVDFLERMAQQHGS